MSSLWSVTDVAAALGVSPRTVHAYRARRLLPEPDQMFGQSPAWKPGVIKAWMAQRPGRGVRRPGTSTS